MVLVGLGAGFVAAVSLTFLAVREVRGVGLTSPLVVGFLAEIKVRCAGLTSPFVSGFFSTEPIAGFEADNLGFGVVEVVVFEAAVGVVFAVASGFVADDFGVGALAVGVVAFLAPDKKKQNTTD